MSRQPKEPYSDSDIEYMRSRPSRFSRVLRKLDARGPVPDRGEQPTGEDASEPVQTGDGGDEAKSPPEKAEYDPEDVAYVEGLKVEEIKAELRKYDISTAGRRDELEKRLLAALSDDDSD